MNVMNVEMGADLIVSGGSQFLPDHLQLEHGLTPDAIWRIGDPIGRSSRVRGFNAWVLSTGSFQGGSIGSCVSRLLDKARPMWGRLQAVCMEENLHVECSIVLYIRDDSPEVHLNKDSIHRLAQLGAELDIDIILLPSRDGQNGAGGISLRRPEPAG